MTLFVLLNGPPRSGKDTLGEILREELTRRGLRSVTDKFARPLKEAAHKMLGEVYDPVEHEKAKDVPQPRLRGRTYRQLYIALSEYFFKPFFGQDYFGRVLSNQHKEGDSLVVLVTDSGFEEEARALYSARRDVVRVRISRPGTSFEGDSRSYWIPRGWRPDTYIFTNDFCDVVSLKTSEATSDVASFLAARAKKGGSW